MLQWTTIYSNDIEDRFEARYYINFSKINKNFRIFNNVTIEEIADLKGGYTPNYKHFKEYPALSEIYNNYFPFIKSSNVKRGVLDINNLSFIDKYAHERLLNKSIIHSGDVLIAMTGTVGALTLIPRTISEGNISQNVVRIRMRGEWEDKVPGEYLVALLNSKFGQIQIQGLLTSTNQKYLNQIAIGKIRIPLLENLKVIADTHKQIYNIEAEAFAKIERAKQLLEEILNINHQEINEDKVYSVNSSDLTDILTPKFYFPKYVNTLKVLKKKFKTIKLGEIADIKRGDEVGSKNYHKYIDRKDSDVPFIRTSDLVNYEIDNYPDYYVDESIYKELKQDLEAGDIIYTKDGKIGFPAILTNEDKCILASGLARIRIKKELNPYYVFSVLSTNIGFYQAMQHVVIAATLPHLQQERLKEIEIPLIDNETQNQISQLVAEAFKLKAEKKKLFQEALTKIEELLK